MNNAEFTNKLRQIMEDNPTLEVLCKVDSEIVADDGYGWWLGKLSTRYGVEIDEYSECIGETIKFRSDDDYEDWMEDLYDIDEFEYVSDAEWRDFCKKKVDEVANWKKVIFISITTL